MPLAAIAAIGIGGSIAGAAISSHAAGSAANTQANAANYAANLQKQAADQSLAFQKEQFNTQQAQAQPWLQSGYSALANLDYLLGLTPQSGTATPANAGTTSTGTTIPRPNPKMSDFYDDPEGKRFQGGIPSAAVSSAAGAAVPAGADLSKLVNPQLGQFGSLMQGFGEKFAAPTGLTEQNDPGFQARLKLGTDALERSAAAKGGALSGGTMKDLNSFAQDYASNEYGNVYNRAWNEYANKYNQFENNQTNQFNRLAALSGVGQTTASQLGVLGQNAATNMGNTVMNSAAQQGQQANNAAAARASGYVASGNAWGGAINNGAQNITQLLLLKQMGMV